jgi:hypothetical protein
MACTVKSVELPWTTNSELVLDSVPATVAEAVNFRLTQGTYDSA